jgi:hypothetical protein
MKKSHKRVGRQKSGTIESLRGGIDLRTVGVEDASKALLQSCADLPIAHRERFILLLLKQTRLPGGTACYLAWDKWDCWQRRSAYLNLLEISEDLANSWYAWAWALSNERAFRRPLEGVSRLIGKLIEQIAMEEVNQWLRG